MKYIVILASILCFACSKSEQIEAQLSFSTKTFTSERCVDDNCAEVKVSWPVAENVPAASLINEEIGLQLLAYFQQDKTYDNLDSAANDYLNSYEEFKSDFPDAPGGWSIEVNVEKTYESDSTLSFKFTEFNFSGGAHPNSSVYYMNFDAQSGEYLSIDRVVLDEKKMLEIAEKAFRKHHGAEEGKSLEEAGFFLPETGFFLPNAMGYEDEKFHLTYIPYEIGPYVMGYTELEFELQDLRGIVRWK
ncbi:DUF3298 and DUF4163 domain-containing protein [Algoriphagus aquimarinus]|uniref:Uncharacterized protein n=1 Tax=Algoriphagus aquimarinus TaxID=237018 RepID=A0A1I0YUF9_9BACT|nr:DUF3298 and DUF4163 domain-containing protein [Algoriphagus aquimarinus]SFB16617.1 protein of unknown function [Algoriphagus aquimarinus]